MLKENRNPALRRLTVYAVLTALGVVLSRFLAIDAGALRFHFGALPPLLAGIAFGPLGGAIVGGLADALGGLLVGYSINPLITLGAAAIGWTCGIVYRALPAESRRVRICCGIFAGHLLGSICINSLVLHFFYGYAWAALAPRVFTYLFLSVLESIVLCLLLKNTAFSALLRRMGAKEGVHYGR